MVAGDSKEGKVDLVGLVSAKEPRPLRKTFGLLFTLLNIRSRRCMNGYILTLEVWMFLRNCSLSLFKFEILRNKQMRTMKMISVNQ